MGQTFPPGQQPGVARELDPGSRRSLIFRGATLLPVGALLFIIVGLAFRLSGTPGSRLIWTAGLVITGGPVAWRTLRGVLRGSFAVDLVAMLAVVGALLLGEPLAGLIVVLMQTGGEALERFAEGRASEAVRELAAMAPRLAHRLTKEGIEDVAAEDVAVGDRLLLRPGELLACDAVVEEGRSHVDTSRITGEPVPVRAEAGIRIPSGSLNLDGPLTVRVLATAKESQYARIVELVRTAQASKAPLQRLADRYAVWFTPATLLVCGLAYAISGDPVRVLAVLVVATPCPLILAAPVAVIGGINRAARHGIVFRHGTALEQLGEVTIALFDKTGTLTLGRPRVSRVLPVAPFTEAELLRLAAAVERGSGHLLARTLVDEAEARGAPVVVGHQVVEAAGQGVRGMVDGQDVAVGSWSYVTGGRSVLAEGFRRVLGADEAAELRAFVSVDGTAAGIVEYADRPRPGMAEFVQDLRGLGLRRLVLLSGDDQANTVGVARTVGIAEAHGDLLPEGKVAFVHHLTKSGEKVLMMGDGTNDAPALSSASVGIALAAGGGGVTAEAADAVILADDPSRVAIAIRISRRTLRIARQSIWVGLGLSGLGMAAATAGWLAPIPGALLQELIDIAVILNALRASFAPRGVAHRH
jgi:heavy metal translocating P-type ATPase